MLLQPGGQVLWYIAVAHLDECETPAQVIGACMSISSCTCQIGKSGRKMADYLHDALSMQAGNSPGTLGPESAIDQGFGTARGRPQLFRHLKQGAL